MVPSLKLSERRIPFNVRVTGIIFGDPDDPEDVTVMFAV